MTRALPTSLLADSRYDTSGTLSASTGVGTATMINSASEMSPGIAVN